MILKFQNFKVNYKALLVATFVVTSIVACKDDEETTPAGDDSSNNEFASLLTNQVDEVIIPTMQSYKTAVDNLNNAVRAFEKAETQANLDVVESTFKSAYLA